MIHYLRSIGLAAVLSAGVSCADALMLRAAKKPGRRRIRRGKDPLFIRGNM